MTMKMLVEMTMMTMKITKIHHPPTQGQETTRMSSRVPEKPEFSYHFFLTWFSTKINYS